MSPSGGAAVPAPEKVKLFASSDQYEFGTYILAEASYTMKEARRYAGSM